MDTYLASSSGRRYKAELPPDNWTRGAVRGVDPWVAAVRTLQSADDLHLDAKLVKNGRERGIAIFYANVLCQPGEDGGFFVRDEFLKRRC
ncbi:MAG: hypothetical protein WBC70_05725 [Candidatus Aminicenantales bacterium]